MKTLFADDTRPEFETYNSNLPEPPIQINEVNKAILEAKSNKAAGLDKIPSEILKLFDYYNIVLLQKILNKKCDSIVSPKMVETNVYLALQEGMDMARMTTDAMTIN